VNKIQAGTTRELTWVWSGSSPDSLYVAIVDGEESTVSSQSMVSSGGGLYYAEVTLPSSKGYYVASFNATIGGNPYIDKIPFKIVYTEVN
jgi:hypothetical protein